MADPYSTSTGYGDSQGWSAFSEKAIRQAFVRKVYSILMIQLLFTFAIVAIFVFENHVNTFVRTTQAGMIIYIVSYVVFIILVFMLSCCEGPRRRFPFNIISLGLLTAALSYMTGCISAFHDTQIVMIAFGMTVAICLGITLISFYSKFDFTGCGIYLFIASLVLLVFGIVCAIVRNNYASLVYSALAALLFMFYLAYHTQLIIGERKYELSPEEYILAALMLYLDVVNLFLALLGILRRS